MNERVIIAHPPELGGGSAVSQVALGYQGVCSVVDKYTGEGLATLPNGYEAEQVAAYASTPDGGQLSTKVIPSPESVLSHDTFREWLGT